MLKLFEKYRSLSFFMLFVTGIGIYYVSSLTFKSTTPTINFLSIVYHISAFFVFCFFMLVFSTQGKKRYDLMVLSILLSLIYAGLDELHQYFVLGRCSSFIDIGLDSIGIFLSFMIYFVIILYRERSSLKRI